MEDLSWKLAMADDLASVVSIREHSDDPSDDDFLMDVVMDDISVVNNGIESVVDVETNLRSDSNQSPVCVMGFFDNFFVEHPVERHDDDDANTGDHLGTGWDGKLDKITPVDNSDDDVNLPSIEEEFVNFDKLDDAISKLCDPILNSAPQPVAVTPPVATRKKVKVSTEKILRAKPTLRKTRSMAKPTVAKKIVKRKVSVAKALPKPFRIRKAKKEDILSPPVTPDGRIKSKDLATPSAPIPAQRHLFLPAFDKRNMPRSIPDAVQSIDTTDEDDLLPFHPVPGMPAVIKEEPQDLVKKPTGKKPSAVKNATKKPVKGLKTVMKSQVTAPKIVAKPQAVASAPAPAPGFKKENDWVQALSQVKAFIAQHGHAMIPYKYPENPKLASWAKRQRYQYKIYQEIQNGIPTGNNKTSSLTPERIEALDSVGFVWNLHDVQWEGMFQEFQEFVRREGHGKVPKFQQTLGRWVGSQRTQLANRTLPIERFIKLRDAGFDFWVGKKPNQKAVDSYADLEEIVAKQDQANFLKCVKGVKGLGNDGDDEF